MKRNFRYLVFLALIIATFFGTSKPTSSASANARIPDPACVSSCTFEMSLCFANGGKNNDHDNACFSIYRHCIAQCGKHD